MASDISKQLQMINKQLATFGPAVQVAKILGVAPLAALVAVAFGSVVAFMLFFDILTGFIYSLVGLVYPTYATFKIIESKGESKLTSACLTYWTVFGIFTLCESFIDGFLSWVPLYSIARVAFQIWLFIGDFAGAVTVYAVAVLPVLSKVDVVVTQIKKEIVDSETK